MNPDARTSSLADVVILIVLAQGLNVWWSAESPYNGAKSMSHRSLRRYEVGASGFTVLFGLFASYLTRKALPAIAAIVFCVAMIWLYEYEWSHANLSGVAHDEPPITGEVEAQALTASESPYPFLIET